MSGARVILSLALCAAVMIVDGYDLSAMPLAVPHISRAFGIAPQDFGPALSAVLIGLGAGAIFVGPIGDRIGRRPVIIGLVALIGLATIGTASATSLNQFFWWRLLTGLALGGCLPNVSALSSELPSAARRASSMTIVSIGISLGAIVAGLVSPLLVAAGGWQAIFILPGIATLALAFILFFLLPESPRLARDAPATTDRRAQWSALFRPPLVVGLAIFALLYGVNAFALYLLQSWLPTILPGAGFTLNQAARYLSLYQFGGMLFALALSPLLDRNLAAISIAGAYALVTLALVAFSFVPVDPVGWGLLLLVAGGGISGAHLAIMAASASFFPPRLLSSAIGIGVAVARIGAIAGPLLGSSVVASGASVQQFFLIVAMPAGVCLLLAALIPLGQKAAARFT